MIPLFKVHAPENIGEIIQQVFDKGFVTEGVYADRFEAAFGQYIRNPNTCLVNSCTSALTLACHLSDIKPGDEVITTAMTCIATNEPFFNAGARLVFADIDRDTGNLDPVSVESKITPKTRAIVGVHWSGQPFDLDTINEMASSRDIRVIEDAAHALRAEYKGQRIGSHSDFVCFSFQAIKHLTTADGGAIACRNKEDAVRIRKIRWFGLDRKHKGSSRWEQDIPESGFKMHMNNINAAIGLEQMKYVDGLIDAHVENGQYYDQGIATPHVQPLKAIPGCRSSYWIYTVLVENRADFQTYMNMKGIATDVVHVRNDQYTVFQEFAGDELPGLDFFESRQVNIPVGWWLSEEDRETVLGAVNAYRPLT